MTRSRKVALLAVALLIIAAVGYSFYLTDQRDHAAARRYICGLRYQPYSEAWSNCMADR